MARYLKHCVESAFAPFVAAAGGPNYAAQLTTADLPEERKAAQFSKFRSLKPFGGDPLYLPGNGFIARFAHSAGAFLCVSDHHLDDEGKEELNEWAAGEGLLEGALDEASFLVLCDELGGFYKPLGLNMKKERAENLLGVVNDAYEGHDINDIIEWYQSVSIFDIPEDHYALTANAYRIAAGLVSSNRAYRPEIIGDEMATAIHALNLLPNINPENLYFALTSTHWKHTFLDLYKCLEAIFYLPWTSVLRDSLKSELTALALAKECRRSLIWREREKVSIARLFETLPDLICKPPTLAAIAPLQDLVGNNANKDKYGERIYKIRNELVHQEDYEDPTPIEIPKNFWLPICLYLSGILKELYTSRAPDIDYVFELEVGELPTKAVKPA
ncbi:MAG: hypothetical protein KA085_08705 [Phenylobacterium sp.]|uniref:hypothetical protein n=1 Tax=Phenylobacterium sp. TaxID=1871053 RepID=UPI001B6F1FEE|nr:hypothetical protein [Phenylobacterium sp.]MBP7816191.1 hypothetical protein [Phenylobacterium sp.]